MKEYLGCILEQEDSGIVDACSAVMTEDIESGQVCKAYNDLTYCMSNGYGKACGYGITPLMCNMFQREIQALDKQDQCQWFDCSKPFPFNGTFI